MRPLPMPAPCQPLPPPSEKLHGTPSLGKPHAGLQGRRVETNQCRLPGGAWRQRKPLNDCALHCALLPSAPSGARRRVSYEAIGSDPDVRLALQFTMLPRATRHALLPPDSPRSARRQHHTHFPDGDTSPAQPHKAGLAPALSDVSLPRSVSRAPSLGGGWA